MTKAKQLELELMQYIEGGGKAQWRHIGLPDFARLVPQADTRDVADALHRLNDEGLVELQRWRSDVGEHLPYERFPNSDIFFFFEMTTPPRARLTSRGRAELEQRLEAESGRAVVDLPSPQAGTSVPQDLSLEALLHPVVREAAYDRFLNGHLREAVLNSILAIGDQLRARTGLELDGDELIGRALSLEDPYIVLSELKTTSGKNDQKGFMQILKGAFQGIRNPKAPALLMI